MRKQFIARVNGHYKLVSKRKYSEAQLADLDVMFEKFGNMILRDIKTNPKLLETLDVSEMDQVITA